MTSPHLSERALQEAAESASLLPAAEGAHLRSCPVCQGRVATYRHVLTAVAELPPPSFSFDLTASVLAQLPPPKPAFPWALCGVAALVLGVIVVFLSLFGPLLVPIFQGLSTRLGAAVGLFMAAQMLQLLARHRQQLRLLTFS